MRRRGWFAVPTAAFALMGCTSDDGRGQATSTSATATSASTPTFETPPHTEVESIPVASIGPDGEIAPGHTATADVGVHCGAALLSVRVNGKWWRTAEAHDRGDWLPVEWGGTSDVPAVLRVLIDLDDSGEELRVTFGGRSVVYAPTELTDADLCD